MSPLLVHFLTTRFPLTLVLTSTTRSCRNGLPDPPKKTKAVEVSNATAKGKDAPPKAKKSTSSVQRLHTQSSIKAARNEKTLQDLEKRHDALGISQNLGLSSGQRIKLEKAQPTGEAAKVVASAPVSSKAKTKHKAKATPNYDLSFTDLGEAGLTLSDNFYGSDIVLSDDNEDLPNTVTVLTTAAAKNTVEPKAKVQLKASSTKIKHTKVISPGKSSSLKRAASVISLSDDSDIEVRPIEFKPSAKRTKITARPPVQESAVDMLSAQPDPLFIESESNSSMWWDGFDAAGSDTVNGTPSKDAGDCDDFSLADDIVAYLGDLGPCDERKSSTEAAHPKFSPAAPESSNTLRTESIADPEAEVDAQDPEYDDFADLDAWLV